MLVGITLQNQAQLQLVEVLKYLEGSWNYASKSSTVTTKARN